MIDRSLETDLEPKPKKGKREKDSSGAARRGFSKAQRAFAGRLSKPGYTAACHSRKPEAFIKVVGDAPRGHNVRKLLHYISRTQDLDETQQAQAEAIREVQDRNVYLVDSDGKEYVNRADVERLAQEWAELFQAQADAKPIAQRADTKRKTRDVQHLVLSAKAEQSPENMRRVLRAAQVTAERQLAGYDYVLGLHQDSKHPHVHIVVRCDRKDRKRGKLRLNKPELLLMRTAWAQALTEQGLEHVATMRQDRPHVMEEVAQGRATIRGQRMSWYRASINGMAEGMEFLEKRQADLKAALERQGAREEATKIRQEIGQRINDLRQHIRANTKQGDKARLQAFNELRKIERCLQKQADPYATFQELMSKAGAHKPAYLYIAKSLESGKRLVGSGQTATTPAEAQKAYELHEAAMRDARSAANRMGGMTKEQYAVAMRVLEIHDEAARKALGLAPKQPKALKSPAQQPTKTPPTVAPTKPRDSGIER